MHQSVAETCLHKYLLLLDSCLLNTTATGFLGTVLGHEEYPVQKTTGTTVLLQQEHNYGTSSKSVVKVTRMGVLTMVTFPNSSKRWCITALSLFCLYFLLNVPVDILRMLEYWLHVHLFNPLIKSLEIYKPFAVESQAVFKYIKTTHSASLSSHCDCRNDSTSLFQSEMLIIQLNDQGMSH